MADKKKKKKTYKEIHGTTRVGDFLRSIGKGETLGKVLEVVGNVATGGGLGSVLEVLGSSKELTAEEREYALKMAELDFREAEEVTKRWQADMTSDSKLSKNIRPAILITLTGAFLVLVGIDSIDNLGFDITNAYSDTLKALLMTVYSAYFGGRSVEKVAKIIKNT